MTSRWIEDNGFERQTFSIGQAIYFADRKVQMPVSTTAPVKMRSPTSPYALEYMYRFNRDWRLDLRLQLGWRNPPHPLRQRDVPLPAGRQPNKVVNAGFRYRDDTIRYDQASGTWTWQRLRHSGTDPTTSRHSRRTAMTSPSSGRWSRSGT